jgi:hypothetical protein
MGPIYELVGSSIHHADDFDIAGSIERTARRDQTFTTKRRQVSWPKMLKKISSPWVGNPIARSVRMEERRSITRDLPRLGQYDSGPNVAVLLAIVRSHPG